VVRLVHELDRIGQSPPLEALVVMRVDEFERLLAVDEPFELFG
jgi:hypothetical protein